MARTLEIEEEEESRIAELERIAREGDEIEKMIAEVQLAEERERVVGAEELALQAEAETPKGKPEDVPTPEETFLEPYKGSDKRGREKKPKDMPTTEEMFPAGKDLFTEEEFWKKFGWSKEEGMRRVEEQRQDELAKEAAVRESARQKALNKITGKSVDDWFEQRERYRKDKLEQYPRATFGQKVQEGLSLGLLTPATKANVDSAAAVGAALAEFDARTKLNNATSSAKSRRVEGALTSGQVGNVADATAWWENNRNRAYRASEVAAGRTPPSFRILNLPPNATVAKQDAAMQRTLKLAKLGNPNSQMDLASLVAVGKAQDDFLKTKSDREHAALVKATERAAVQQGIYYKDIGGEYAASASAKGGIFSMESLSPDLKAVAYDEDGNLTVKGAYMLSGSQGFITEEAIAKSTAVREQLATGAPTAQALRAREEASTGVKQVDWGNLTRSQQLYLTNPANIKAHEERLGEIEAYKEASGVQPQHFANAAKHRDEVVAMKINAEEELASIDKELGDPSTSAAQRAVLIGKRTWMKLGLGGLNRNVQKAEYGVASAHSDMKRDTADMVAETEAGRKRKETKEMALWDIGQKNMELFRKHIAPNTWEQQNRARALEGKMKGLNAYEWTFFETNAEGKPIDVREVFKPWLTMRTQSAKGGTPDDDQEGGGVFLPNWGTRVSNGLFWNREALANSRIIDVERKIYPFWDEKPDSDKGKPVQEFFEQREAYRTAQAEWELEYPKPADTEAVVAQPQPQAVVAQPQSQAMTTPAPPTAVTPAPAPAVPEAITTPFPPVSPEEKVYVELEATNIMNDAKADANGIPYAENQEVPFKNALFPDAVRGRTFIFKTDEWGNPYWLLKE